MLLTKNNEFQLKKKDLGHLTDVFDFLNFHPSVFCFGLSFSDRIMFEHCLFYDTFSTEM